MKPNIQILVISAWRKISLNITNNQFVLNCSRRTPQCLSFKDQDSIVNYPLKVNNDNDIFPYLV